MEHPQNHDMKGRFEAAQLRQFLLTFPVIAVVITLIALKEGSTLWGLSYDMVGKIGFGIIVVVLILSFKNWRCPACDSYLGKHLNPEFCSKCGVKLQ